VKGSLLLALSSFAASPEFAPFIWQQLESSQILPTLPKQRGAPATPQDGFCPFQLIYSFISGIIFFFFAEGIKYELEHVEAKAETYPECKGFLILLQRLLESSGIPENLGSGYRVPGFQPFLHFSIDSCFLRLSSRAYSDPKEKEEISTICLKIFYQLLLLLDVGQGVVSQTEQNLIHRHPGFEVLLRILCGTRLLPSV